jgi:hypothetical protein
LIDCARTSDARLIGVITDALKLPHQANIAQQDIMDRSIAISFRSTWHRSAPLEVNGTEMPQKPTSSEGTLSEPGRGHPRQEPAYNAARPNQRRSGMVQVSGGIHNR